MSKDIALHNGYKLLHNTGLTQVVMPWVNKNFPQSHLKDIWSISECLDGAFPQWGELETTHGVILLFSSLEYILIYKAKIYSRGADGCYFKVIKKSREYLNSERIKTLIKEALHSELLLRFGGFLPLRTPNTVPITEPVCPRIDL